MSTDNYISIPIKYKTLDGNWEPIDNVDLQYYTLTSNPLELKVDFDHPEIVGQPDLYLSHNNVQWDIDEGKGLHNIVKTPELKYTFRVPGKKGIQVYIATSEGNVKSRGLGSSQVSIPLTASNFLGTGVAVAPVTGYGEIEKAVTTIDTADPTTGPITEEVGTIIHLSAGEVSMPLEIHTQHSWQLYDETPTPYKVTLYADESGLDYTAEGIAGTNSLPLVSPAYLDNKYAQFQKTWRFSTTNDGLNPVDSINTSITKLYARKKSTNDGFEFCPEEATGAEFVGTSGTDTVYYIDDTPAYEYADDLGPHVYRINFQLDTVGWPTKDSVLWLDTAEMKSDSEYTDTPQIHQGDLDYLYANVHPSRCHHLIATPAGIEGIDFQISKIKYQHTIIPFVISFGTESGRIIKDNGVDYPDFHEPNPTWKMVRGTSGSMQPNTLYVDLLSADDFGFGTVGEDIALIKPDDTVFNVPQYSSSSWTLSSNQLISNAHFHVMLTTTAPVTTAFGPTPGSIITTAGISGPAGASNHTVLPPGWLGVYSRRFDVLPYTGTNIFLRHGEEIDYGEVVNSYSLQENINQHGRLENTINAIFGRGHTLPSATGKILHEKIQNFTANNVDIDVCNIPAIYSLTDEVGSTVDNYDFSPPGGIRRLMDTLSVGISKLTGDRDRYQEDYTETATVNLSGNVEFGRNIGKSPIDISTYMVSAGVPFIAKELYGNVITKIIPSYIPGSTTALHYDTSYNLNGLSSYPLTDYDRSWNWGLSYPEDTNIFSDYYEFYEYIDNSTFPVTDFNQLHGIINWEATNALSGSFSTLSETATGYSEWFDRYKIVDTMIEWSLRNGLEHIDNPQ